MSNEELLSEFELTVAAYAINADNKSIDMCKTEAYLEKLKLEIIVRMNNN